MDAKTILILSAGLIAAGYTGQNLLSIAGLIKTNVIGGVGSRVAYLAGTLASIIGWGIFFVLLVTNGITITNAMSCLFGR